MPCLVLEQTLRVESGSNSPSRIVRCVQPVEGQTGHFGRPGGVRGLRRRRAAGREASSALSSIVRRVPCGEGWCHGGGRAPPGSGRSPRGSRPAGHGLRADQDAGEEGAPTRQRGRTRRPAEAVGAGRQPCRGGLRQVRCSGEAVVRRDRGGIRLRGGARPSTSLDSVWLPGDGGASVRAVPLSPSPPLGRLGERKPVGTRVCCTAI